MALLTALIGQTIKLRWKLSLQVRGDGPVRLIATDYYGPAERRARADPRLCQLRCRGAPKGQQPPFDRIGKGYFAILIDQGHGMHPLSGDHPAGGRIAGGCAEAYFAQSEQLPTRFALAYGGPGGPGACEAGAPAASCCSTCPRPRRMSPGGGSGEGGCCSRATCWTATTRRTGAAPTCLLDTVETLELIGPQLCSRPIFCCGCSTRSGPRVFDAQPVGFGCTCSADRVRQSAVDLLGQGHRHMTTEAGIVTADCQFCGRITSSTPRRWASRRGQPP